MLVQNTALKIWLTYIIASKRSQYNPLATTSRPHWSIEWLMEARNFAFSDASCLQNTQMACFIIFIQCVSKGQVWHRHSSHPTCWREPEIGCSPVRPKPPSETKDRNCNYGRCDSECTVWLYAESLEHAQKDGLSPSTFEHHNHRYVVYNDGKPAAAV